MHTGPTGSEAETEKQHPKLQKNVFETPIADIYRRSAFPMT